MAPGPRSYLASRPKPDNPQHADPDLLSLSWISGCAMCGADVALTAVPEPSSVVRAQRGLGPGLRELVCERGNGRESDRRNQVCDAPAGQRGYRPTRLLGRARY
eukprot:2578215-Rhodomonas_salina.1